jgi:hypothetical protein
MERRTRHRPARHRRPLASKGFSTVLASHFEAWSWAIAAEWRSEWDSNLEYCSSLERIKSESKPPNLATEKNASRGVL